MWNRVVTPSPRRVQLSFDGVAVWHQAINRDLALPVPYPTTGSAGTPLTELPVDQILLSSQRPLATALNRVTAELCEASRGSAARPRSAVTANYIERARRRPHIPPSTLTDPNRRFGNAPPVPASPNPRDGTARAQESTHASLAKVFVAMPCNEFAVRGAATERHARRRAPKGRDRRAAAGASATPLCYMTSTDGRRLSRRGCLASSSSSWPGDVLTGKLDRCAVGRSCADTLYGSSGPPTKGRRQLLPDNGQDRPTWPFSRREPSASPHRGRSRSP